MNEHISRLKFALRDDDVDFWTDPNVLESLYRPFWDIGGVVSFAVIPFGIETYDRGKPETFYQVPNTQRAVGENLALVAYLREKIEQGKVDILLHGYDHEYKVEGKQKWIPECLWKSQEQLEKEMKDGRTYLEELFDRTVSVYVPPSNSIDKKGITAMEAAGLQLSGTIGRSKDRAMSLSYVQAYMWRAFTAWLYSGSLYPHVMKIGSHLELAAQPVTSQVALDSLMAYIQVCKKMSAPCVLATHHWELMQKKALRDLCYDFFSSEEMNAIALSDAYHTHTYEAI